MTKSLERRLARLEECLRPPATRTLSRSTLLPQMAKSSKREYSNSPGARRNYLPPIVGADGADDNDAMKAL
jgi:hypothetical protein